MFFVVCSFVIAILVVVGGGVIVVVVVVVTFKFPILGCSPWNRKRVMIVSRVFALESVFL